ncbi:hypothetical protein [Phenylobacterium sp.]|uniref:hypothetical protein n=1 Tax=Phenylobacterium sp. TaxID=1871053 RepID=UPI00301D838C
MRLPLALAPALIPAAALVLVATPTLAADADDAPVATASAQPAPEPTVAEQIDAYLKSSPVLEADEADALPGVVPRRDRRIHGEVAVGVGTGGYRSVYARADMPVGETGRVSIAVQEARGRFGPVWAGGLDRQRCDLEGLGPPRPLDMIGGPHGRCVGSVPFR